ncbi:MAG: Crp/Fnr family transcriptional regulator [Prevotellaceae bacterium]|jgi:CRP-like cAMP-binding protein|nr:Crp/Fnr family transcriptional regulator [Prevotellaceae bacterium]
MSQAIVDNNAHMDAISSTLIYLTSKEKEIVKKNMACTSYRKGEVIYKEGETPEGLTFLVKGKVKIYKEGIGGRDWIARMVKPVEMVGYRAVFAEENYNASAQTIEDSVICIVDKRVIFSILRNNPDLMFFIMKMLAAELGHSNTRTVTLTQKHIRGRLAETLLFLRDTYGFEEDGQTLKVYLSREDLANLSNMTASNAIRTLSSFNSEGIIVLDGRKIKMVNMPQIEKISRLG